MGSALNGRVDHVSGYDPRSVVIDLADGSHDLQPDDEVAVHAVKHAAEDAGETFSEVLGQKLADAYEGKLIERLAELEAIVRDLADSAVEFDDSRVGWLSARVAARLAGCRHPSPAPSGTAAGRSSSASPAGATATTT